MQVEDKDTLVEAHEKKKELPQLLVTRDQIQAVLADDAHTPEQVLALFQSDYKEGYAHSAEVREGYTIGEHTSMALRQFDKYFRKQGNKTSELMEVIISLREVLGKPPAIAEGNKAQWHMHTVARLPVVLEQLGYSGDDVTLATALVGADPIGEYLKTGDTTHVARQILTLSRSARVSPARFYRLVTTLFQVDAGSYTVDAGGQESLDYLFTFDPKQHKMDFSEDVGFKMFKLQRTVERLRIEEAAAQSNAQDTEKRKKEIPGLVEAENTARNFKERWPALMVTLGHNAASREELEQVAATVQEFIQNITNETRTLQDAVDASECSVVTYQRPSSDHPLIDRRSGGCEGALARLAKAQSLLLKWEQDEQRLGAIAHVEEQIRALNERDNIEARKIMEEAEKTITSLSWLGILPATRYKNSLRLKEAEHIRAIASGFLDHKEDARTLVKLPAAMSHVAVFQQAGFGDRASERRELGDTGIDFDRQAVTRDIDWERKELQRLVRESIKEIDVENCLTKLEKYGNVAVTLMEEMRQLEGRLETELYVPFGITRADEERAKSRSGPTTREHLRGARECSYENIRESLRSVVSHYRLEGVDEQELYAQIRESVEKARATAYVSFTDSPIDFSRVLADGSVRSVFDLPYDFRSASRTAQSGMGHLETRREAESVFGFEGDVHPVSMAIGSHSNRDAGPADSYGSINVRFPIELFANDAICTIGDSLNDGSCPRALLKRPKWDRAQNYSSGADASVRKRLRTVTAEHGLIAKGLLDIVIEQGDIDNYFRPLSYIEALVPGPIALTDATEIVIAKEKAVGEAENYVAAYGSLENFTNMVASKLPNIPVRMGETATPERLAVYSPSEIKAYGKFFTAA